ncbi:Tap42 interacting protein [Coemansia sp. RSA 2706]|nr:Tap42 interacting protein [Coemansia sp. RSA 2711]KAJ2299631.1 Tap42 interacting protein [Coemansia sp. RSA 2706]KAJ2303402.1 Tap42 interacting protein [Coemansia sp. RSA 2705]KAJ2309932.1 Tap42 interacting protein [Coemansia sp. RSA 2704]KAJ2716243.1 Tap42 interacting protein [Coemansia sp. Cherry 401B]
MDRQPIDRDWEPIDRDGVRGLRIGGWELTTHHGSILSHAAVEAHAARLGFTPPEMIFGDGFLRARHQSGAELSLAALDALQMVRTGVDAARAVQVSVADGWSDARRTHGMATVNPFDWTYSTLYRGSGSLAFAPCDQGIDYALLRQREEILFYDEGVLFEDDLGDNGCAQLAFRVRVMPSGFFVLMRFFLRVDGVLFRIYDTRLHHCFGSTRVVREFSRRQAPFDDVKRQLPRSGPDDEDLSLLNNIQFVDGVIGDPEIDCEVAVLEPRE